MNSRALAVVTTVVFVLLGGLEAWLAQFRVVPSAVTLVAIAAFFAGVYTALYPAAGADAPNRRTSWGLRAFLLIACLALTASVVRATGGPDSPFAGLLFLPILLATLFSGFTGGVLTGAVASLVFMVIASGALGGGPVPPNAPLIKALVYVEVSIAVGWFAETLRRAAETAADRARTEQARAAAHEARAAETEAFLDTSLMMESMYDVENTLNVALLRLAELVDYDTCAVYLREGEGGTLQIARLTGLPVDAVGVRTLPLEPTAAALGGENQARLWPDVTNDAAGLGALKNLDPAARTVIVAPLRTAVPSPRPNEDFYGVIYVATRRPRALTERHRELVTQFAQHVVFPIQRMRLQALATTDAMTGLDNYRSFRLRLADEARRAYRYEHTLSLILLDIDHFKRVNDTHGHTSGDAILRQTAAILRKSLRGIDVAARYGGEEMAIICPETSSADALTLAERIRATVESNEFDLPGDGTLRLTVSLGVATLPTDAAGDASLIEEADRALYAAKAGGRNRVRQAGDGAIQPASV